MRVNKQRKGLFTVATAVLLCLLFSCRGSTTERGTDGDTIAMKYARNITLIEHEDYLEAVLRNPWDTAKTLNRYEIREPMKHVAVFTSVLCALLEEIDAEQSIVAVCEPEYIHLQYVHDGLRDGTIKNLGNSLDPNIEMLMDLQVDAIMASPFENSGGYGLMERMDIPIVECADYMEVSPLARAEWVRFYGRLFGRGEKADSIFEAVEQDYLKLKEKSSNVSGEPSLVVDKPYQGIWYVNGGGSTMGVMYRDAGAKYVFADRPERGNIPMSLEAVLEAGQEADYWLLKYSSPSPLTMNELASDNAVYRHFTAFKEGHVYGCNTMTSRFFEQTPYHPERLLADIVSILHPSLGVEAEYKYYHRLDEE